MKNLKGEFPLSIHISFKKLFESYRSNLNATSELHQHRAEQILAIADAYPILTTGLTTEAQLKKYKKQIDLILEDLFSSVLEKNEIKTATIPFQELVFKSSQRYKDIIAAAGSEYQLKLMNFDEDNLYIMGCSIILNAYYGYKADFRRPFYYNIPDENGAIRNYKVLMNGDFIEIEKTKNAKDITEDDYLELLENFDNVAIWKEKFPPESWISKGFIVANMYDATVDVSLTNFKAGLLKDETKDENYIEDFQIIMQSIFNLPDLQVGYTIFNEEEGVFEKAPKMLNVTSYILNEKESGACNSALCSRSYDSLFQKQEFYCISDVKKYHKLYPDNILYKTLFAQDVQSAIITAIVSEGKVLGVMEIVSPNPYELNTINANKLHDVMPYLVDSVKRSKERKENEVELLIQNECTSIHSSVHWKFKREAERVMKSTMDGDSSSFKEVVFDEVYPLYGQIDIKGSSQARNDATKKDLILQLEHVQEIVKKIFIEEPLPIYEQLDFRISEYLVQLEAHFQVDSERHIVSFLNTEILPLYQHVKKMHPKLEPLIDAYYKRIDSDKGFVYQHRKDYDESVMLINKQMASILDAKQEDAQQMYPHYFERFKTDGVEHNLYIGESITKEKSFNKIYLYNLRLWQLQVMCEMENSFYKLKEELPVSLDVASMILVFNSPLALRFRMDEKRFDVDGTYNARYEVVKKRVDKANIKGTKQRVTQAGKISIIYSQKEDEIEFMKYISFLQAKKQLDDTVEIVDLDDLQGVTGLKAIRVNVLYNRGEKDKEYYTYEDLMNEIGA